MLTRILLAALGAFAVLASPSAAPASAGTKPEIFANWQNLALKGHDPVAYFTHGAPAQGLPAFETAYKGVKFRFASAQNLAAFKAAPDRYLPRYGGYCAWAAAQGYTAPGDPDHWKIVNGRLYLNYNAEVQAKWEKNIPGFIAKADANWPNVLTK